MSAYILLIPLNYIFSRNFENDKEQSAVTSSQIVGAYSTYRVNWSNSFVILIVFVADSTLNVEKKGEKVS